MGAARACFCQPRGSAPRVLGLLLAAGVAGGASAQELAALPADLTELSLDELLGIEVTSVSRRAEPLSQAAGAIYVLTGDHIRRSGARSIAEALRLVPGLHVARTNLSTQQYAISARGFNSGTADKLEVLLDGRSVYTPLFSGVFWDTLDTYLPDIDRIEVIRGPGAALWGANAVNGVINIVTRSASQTVGTHVTAGGGDDERAFGGVRTGTRAGDGHVRFYAQAFERDDGRRPNGSAAPAELRLRQGGLRGDWGEDQVHGASLIGDVYEGTRGSDTGDIDLDGANLQARYHYRPSSRSALTVKGYFDRYHRMIPAVYEEHRETWDLDLQHELQLGESNRFIYGLGYRSTRDRTGGPPRAFIFAPAGERLETWSAFVQDQLSFAGDAATLTLGSKFEHNDYTGFEFQPSLRLGWQLRERLFTWGAVSRAVRTPNRLDTSLAVFCPPGFPVCTAGQQYLIGNPDVSAEKLIAYEWGLRAWTADRFSLDLALFHNDYGALRSTEAAPPFGRFGDQLEGRGRGAELNADWHALETLDLRAFYTYLDLDLVRKPGSSDANTAASTEGANPQHLAGLEALWSPLPRWTLDGLLRYVGGMSTNRVPGYTELNLRLAWRARPQLELALVGANLIDAQHAEYGLNSPSRLEAERGAFLQVEWQWQP